MLAYAQKHLFDGKKTLLQITDELYEKIHRDGIESVCGLRMSRQDWTLPRKQGIYGGSEPVQRISAFYLLCI